MSDDMRAVLSSKKRSAEVEERRQALLFFHRHYFSFASPHIHSHIKRRQTGEEKKEEIIYNIK